MEENKIVMKGVWEKMYNEALERARQIRDGKDEWRYSDLAEITPALTEIFPELAESEDERIRKVIYKLMLGMREEIFTSQDEIVTKEKVLAYLEKQKEQKPLSTEETELNSIAFLEQMGYTCIPPKKEHQNNSDAPKNALGGGLNSPLDKDNNLDDIAQDYVEAVKEYNPEPTWNLMQTAVCYGYHYREGEEQKPVEWSEEDERIRNAILGFLNPDKGGTKYSSNAELVKWSDWLKSLPLNLKKKNEDVAKLCSNEWSEEDERIIDTIVSVLGQYIDYKAVSGTGSGYATPRYSKEMDWLKSLRPHWKPSKEQMEALNALNCHGGLSYVGQQNQLISLYNDLKKLI